MLENHEEDEEEEEEELVAALSYGDSFDATALIQDVNRYLVLAQLELAFVLNEDPHSKE